MMAGKVILTNCIPTPLVSVNSYVVGEKVNNVATCCKNVKALTILVMVFY
jgi:hypothetical protein